MRRFRARWSSSATRGRRCSMTPNGSWPHDAYPHLTSCSHAGAKAVGMRRSWRTVTTAEVDAAVGRQHERAMFAYEAEQDRLEAEQAEREAWLERIRPEAA